VVVSTLDTAALAIAFVAAGLSDVRVELVETGAFINVVAGATFPLIGALLLSRRDDEVPGAPHLSRLAWLFIGYGVLCAATIALRVIVVWALDRDAPFSTAGAWVSYWLWTGVGPGLLLLLLWFPTGDVPGRRWRPAVYALGFSYAAMFASVAFRPGQMTDYEGHHPNPLGIGGPAGDAIEVIGGAGFVVLAVSAVVAAASLIWRYRTANGDVRDQLRWLVVAWAVIVGTILLPTPSALDGVVLALNVLATVLLPLTLAVALMRRDGRGLPSVLVYGLLSTLLLGAYIAVVGLTEAAFGSRADHVATLIAAGLVAVIAAPLRARLQRAVDRLVYGSRGDPHAALSDLGRRITGSPDDILEEVVRTVADALRSPYVAVALSGDERPAASVGHPTEHEIAVPLVVRGQEVGSLVVAYRRAGERFVAKDLALLKELAQHIGVSAHAAGLTRDLRRSRESIVIAREEERRRIRRDLHDGLGPALAGVALGIDAARNRLADSPGAASAALGQLKEEVQASIADVRRLVYDLRPPALDELGLVPALEAYGARLGERGSFDVSIDADDLPPLPAAVEVAAYRIATEAMTNAARHSHAGRTSVTISIVGGDLHLTVLDDGVGIESQTNGHRGVGLTAMRERASELGGICTVAPAPSGGTAVAASIPVGDVT
jgi:signal transduction histidine kinase